MVIQLIALALLCSSIANGSDGGGPSRAGGSRSPKDDFELVMGAKAEPLRSKASLSLAIDDVAATSARTMAKLEGPKGAISLSARERALFESAGGSDHFSYSRQLGCLPYSTAISALRTQDAEESSSAAAHGMIVPFLVNKNRNAICVFFTRVLPEVQKDFIFHYDIPVSLVIDKKLYTVIDKMFESNSTLHQALGAVPEKREILLVAYPYK